jgi:hypothetical protein
MFVCCGIRAGIPHVLRRAFDALSMQREAGPLAETVWLHGAVQF